MPGLFKRFNWWRWPLLILWLIATDVLIQAICYQPYILFSTHTVANVPVWLQVSLKLAVSFGIVLGSYWLVLRALSVEDRWQMRWIISTTHDLAYIGAGITGALIVPYTLQMARLLMTGSQHVSANQQITLNMYQHADVPTMWMNCILIIAIGPILEELVFRLALMQMFKRLPAWINISVSTSLFALAHVVGSFNTFDFATYLGLGFATAYTMKRTQRLENSILIHVGYNAIATALIFV